MSRCRRAKIEGGVFFFTATLSDRSSDILVREIDRQRRVYVSVKKSYPFETIAICIRPDHLHAVCCLPPGDTDFSLRRNHAVSPAAQTEPRARYPGARKEFGSVVIGSTPYWEHAIRDDTDLERRVDYIHFNPVKHGYVTKACDWPHSSFRRFVAAGVLPLDWGGDVAKVISAFGE
jgi:putative transposase